MNFRSFSFYSFKESQWLGTDSKTQYLDNLKNNYEGLQSNGWIDASFTYKFNSHGFRCDEFTDDDSIMFLGCSHTLGVGLPLEATWAYQTAKALKLKCVNLGQGGCSSDTAYRLASYYIDRLKPKIVVIRPPDPARFEMFNYSTRPIAHNPHSSMSVANYKEWFSCEYNHILNEEKNLGAIELLCNKIKSKFIIAKEVDNDPIKDAARDLMHSGVGNNKQFADNLLNIIGAP